ncbi:MAG: hypothetical protein OXU64_06405 [Gemmatimonadota bacterium]|nr:hypothetical protein [Gemmatimonadota bacterium]
MSLTREDQEWIRGEMVASEARVYRRIKEGALSEVDGKLSEINGKLDSMAEDVAKIPVIESQVREMNGTLQALREYAGV